MHTRASPLLFALLIGAMSMPMAMAQSGTVFTYQGRLLDTSTPANGSYELQFRLYNVAGGGAPLGTYTPPAAIAITQGLLNVPVDFGALFVGADLYLEVGVRAAGGATYTTLSPRQRIMPAPGAMYAQLAAVAGANSVNALSITDGSVGAADINQASVQRRSDQMGTACGAANLSIKTIAPDGAVTCEADDAAGSGWGLNGNAGTNPATNFLGTSDNVPLTFRVNSSAAFRLLPTASVPTVIGGSSLNSAGGAEGATIAGGGEFGGNPGNQALDSFAVVGGGGSNVASKVSATVSGGIYNTASGQGAVVGGGAVNCAGGDFSWAGGRFAQVRPGTASGVPGVACQGVAATPSGDSGTFVWADASTTVPFTSTGPNQFLVRASGGVGINTTALGGEALRVEGGQVDFGTATFVSRKNEPLPPIISHVHYGLTGDWYLRSARPDGKVVLQDSGGTVAIGTAVPFTDSTVTALPLSFNGDVLTFTSSGSTLSSNQNGSIELGADNATPPRFGQTPFIDFHFGRASLVPEDFNVRLVNDGDRRLSVVGNLATSADLSVSGNAFKPLGGPWSVLSDARVKHDIREIETPLDRVLSLHGITFEYNADAGPHAVPGRHMGFIAQEVERVFPDWITEDETGIKAVSIHGFESLLVEAIRELKAQHDVEVEALRAENIALRGRLDRIESLLRHESAE